MLGAMTSRWCWLLTACLACGGADLADDGGVEPPGDAGVDPVDATVTDATTASDAAPFDGGPEDDAGTPEPSVSLGTGQLDFEPIPSDGELELARGGQGGVHLYVAARVVAVEPDRLITRYFGYDAESGLRIFIPTSRSLDPTDVIDEGGSFVRAGDRLILDETRVDQTEIVGRQIRIEVVVEAPDGDLTDSAIITVVDEI